MSPNELDRLFKNGLDSGESTSFNPAHWEGARALLAADKAKQKRESILFLLLILGIGIFNAGLVYFINPQISGKEITPAGEESSRRAMAEFNLNRTGKTSPETEIINESLAVNELNKFSPSENIQEELPKSNKSSSAIAISPSNAQVNSFEGINVVDKLSYAAGPEVRIPSDPVSTLDDLSEMPSKLPLVNSIASRPAELRMSPQDERPDLPGVLFKMRTRPLNRFGWTAALLMQPTSQGAAPVQGVELGFAAEYFFKPRWFAGIAPQVQWRMNQTSFSKFQELTTFSFSAVNRTFGLKANSLQVINIPFYVGWTHKKNILEGGAILNWLVSARGQLHQVDFEGREVVSLNKFSNGWIETDAMNKMTTSLFASYKFKINPRMYTGFSLQLQLGQWYPGLPNQLGQAANQRLTFGWQGIYYIK